MDQKSSAFAGPLAGRRFVKAKDVMELLGYSSRCAFYEWIRREGVPHFRLGSQRIVFDEIALNDWLKKRSVGGKRK